MNKTRLRELAGLPLLEIFDKNNPRAERAYHDSLLRGRNPGYQSSTNQHTTLPPQTPQLTRSHILRSLKDSTLSLYDISQILKAIGPTERVVPVDELRQICQRLDGVDEYEVLNLVGID